MSGSWRFIEDFVTSRLANVLTQSKNDARLPHSQSYNGITCGAKTRSGEPCKNKNLYKNKRCKFHGGPSTGPRTLEGKKISALNTGKTYEELLEEQKN